LVAVYSSRNVFSQGKGIDICMDHHGNAPNNNLWTDIDVVGGAARLLAVVSTVVRMLLSQQPDFVIRAGFW
jgi:hypothetical protein